MHAVSRDSSKPAEGTPHAPLSGADVRRIFYGLMLAMFLSALNQTIVATALPTIGRDFGDFENLSWVIIAYLLASTVVSPLYGKLSDIHGRRAMMLVAIGLFLLIVRARPLVPSSLPGWRGSLSNLLRWLAGLFTGFQLSEMRGAIVSVVPGVGEAVAFPLLSRTGMVGALANGEAEQVPAHPVRGPIDIVGAGDGVTANLTAALAAGAGLVESMELAMAAASVVIL